MRILSITAQKPNSTGSGVYLTELVKEYLTEQDLAKEVEAEKEAIRTLIDKMPNSNLSLEGWGVGKTKERIRSLECQMRCLT